MGTRIVDIARRPQLAVGSPFGLRSQFELAVSTLLAVNSSKFGVLSYQVTV
jgi:hypothetical protein